MKKIGHIRTFEKNHIYTLTQRKIFFRCFDIYKKTKTDWLKRDFKSEFWPKIITKSKQNLFYNHQKTFQQFKKKLDPVQQEIKINVVYIIKSLN